MNALEETIDGLQFLDKLITVYEQGELDFWEDRVDPPNLSKDEFDLVLYRIDRVDYLKWVPRESQQGSRGATGEDDCFKFNCSAEFGGIFGNETKTFFVKGYFFDKDDLKGVTIQSFREE